MIKHIIIVLSIFYVFDRFLIDFDRFGYHLGHPEPSKIELSLTR